jgi:hypothetical protein
MLNGGTARMAAAKSSWWPVGRCCQHCLVPYIGNMFFKRYIRKTHDFQRIFELVGSCQSDQGAPFQNSGSTAGRWFSVKLSRVWSSCTSAVCFECCGRTPSKKGLQTSKLQNMPQSCILNVGTLVIYYIFTIQAVSTLYR